MEAITKENSFLDLSKLSEVQQRKVMSITGIIGHVDHGKTTLTATLQKVLENTTKNINKIIEEEKSIKIEVPYLELPKETRRERRARERKNKKP